MDGNRDQQSTQPPVPETPNTSPVEVEPATDTVAAQPPEQKTTQLEQPRQELLPAASPKPKKKGLLIGLIAAAVVVVLGGGGALAYNFWYQNPEKVVSDGIMNAIKAKTVSYRATIDAKGDSPATVTLTGGITQGAMNVNVESKSKVDGKDLSIKGAGVFDAKGDLYVKVSNADELLSMSMGMSSTSMSDGAKKAINNFVAKINDQWIKISSDDLKGFSESASKSQKCLQDAAKKIQEDKNAASELSDLYGKHKFITVSKKLASKDGSLGYQLDNNKDEAKAFALGLKDTQIYKSLHDCDNSFTIDEKDLTMDDGSQAASTLEVWVSRWSHDITKVVAVSEDKTSPATVTFEPTFNQTLNIAAPDKSKTLGELSKDFEALQSAIMTEYLQSAGVTDSSLYTSGSDTSLFSSEL